MAESLQGTGHLIYASKCACVRVCVCVGVRVCVCVYETGTTTWLGCVKSTSRHWASPGNGSLYTHKNTHIYGIYLFIYTHTHTHTDIDNQHTDANSLYRHNMQTETYHEDERPQTFCQRLAEQQVTDLEASGQLVQIDLLSSHVGFWEWSGGRWSSAGTSFCDVQNMSLLFLYFCDGSWTDAKSSAPPSGTRLSLCHSNGLAHSLHPFH